MLNIYKKNKHMLSPQERANKLLNSTYSFGRITTAEAKSVNYSKLSKIRRSNKK